MKAYQDAKSNKPSFNCKYKKPEWYTLNLIDKLAFYDDLYDYYLAWNNRKNAISVRACINDILTELCTGEIR